MEQQQTNHLEQETYRCPICQDLLKDPVTIPCGHSYCMSCIAHFWDGGVQKIYSCPQCRQTFKKRPVLVKRAMLAALVEQMKMPGRQDAADHCYAAPEDVACDVCTGKKRKALKSCLTCTASYCGNHLQPHHDAAPLKKHKLVEPLEDLQENICSCHNEAMNMFCRTDQQCICYLCPVEEHKGHDTVSAVEERAARQTQLEASRQSIQQRIRDREQEAQLLQPEEEAISRSADEAVEEGEKIVAELIHLVQQKSSDLRQQIRSQQETEVSRVEERQEKLQQEINELRRKDAKLELLSQTEDHTHFLRNYPSLSQASGPTSSINVRPLRYFEDVTAALSKIQDVLRDTWEDVSRAVTEVDVLLSEPQPKSPEDSSELTLDPNTAY